MSVVCRVSVFSGCCLLLVDAWCSLCVLCCVLYKVVVRCLLVAVFSSSLKLFGVCRWLLLVRCSMCVACWSLFVFVVCLINGCSLFVCCCLLIVVV